MDEAPPELASIARTQYRAGTVVAVYFFGSHDLYVCVALLPKHLTNHHSSLVPVDCLRPLLPNWDLFSVRSAGARFQRALVEAQNPEKYRHFERAHQPAKASSPRPDGDRGPSSPVATAGTDATYPLSTPPRLLTH